MRLSNVNCFIKFSKFAFASKIDYDDQAEKDNEGYHHHRQRIVFYSCQLDIQALGRRPVI